MAKTHQNDIEREKSNSGQSPPSRGVPSRETLWLNDLRKLRKEWKYHQGVRLELEQIIQLIFPEKYQKVYNEVATNFMNLLLKKIELHGDDLGTFIKKNDYSKATFYNIILPRLKKVGMVSIKREKFASKHKKQKYYKKIVKPSTEFSIFLKQVGNEYKSIVETAKAKASD